MARDSERERGRDRDSGRERGRDRSRDRDREKSSKKSKKHRKSSSRKDDRDKKRRRRDSSSDYSSSGSESGSDSDRGRKKQKSEKLAQKVVAHLQKTAKGPDAPFVWAKKVEKEIGEGKKLKEISIFSDRNRQQERLEELEKVRKRQAEREAEKARREEELSMVQRMRAAQEAMESEAKEEEFHLKRLLDKAELRLKEGRPAASDEIARNLHVGLRLGDTAEFNHKEPWKYFEGLQLDDVEALHDDIKDYAEYDKYDPLHVEFWKALLEIADHELREARKRDVIDRAHLKGGPEAAAAVAAATADEHPLQPDVEMQVQETLQGSTYGELEVIERQMQADLEAGQGDPEYMLAVLPRIKIAKAKAKVREVQSRIIGATLQRLAQEAAEAAEEMGITEEDGSEYSEETAEDMEEPGDGAGPSHKGGQQGTFGAGTAVATAMGWAKEDRGVSRAAESETEEDQGKDTTTKKGSRQLAAPDNPEEINLDEDEENEDGDGETATGAIGPAPANIVYPSEVPGFGRRYPRKRKNTEGPDPENEARRVGGNVDIPDEVIADGSMSPRYLEQREIGHEDVVNEEDDYKELELLRQQVKLQTSAQFRAARDKLMEAGSFTADRSVRALMRDSGRVGVHPMMRHIAAQDTEGGFRAGIPANLSAEDEQTLAQFKASSMKLMGADGGDRDFGGEVPLEAQVYWWHDKYKPRKPKYFNRVHTGYEWNKYNQTHYDYDNPPPKVVQGYKFNILYHDLIDKTQTPQYVIERDPTSTDNSTCIIRFIAGPPYEDIAFRVVNKEWNLARKHGFRCSFERGILHLFFNFKRTRYRR